MKAVPLDYKPIAPRAPEGPLDLEALVPGEGELELDIGFGRGMSIFQRVRVAPTARIVGIEIKAKLAFRVEERRKAQGLTNVRAFAGEVKDLLTRAGPDGCVARASLHFPDPWWKKRHERRRVIGDDLLDQLARLLRPGGELLIQTDVEDRAVDYRAILSEHPSFGVPETLDANPFGSISNREKRAIEDGLPVHRMLGRRNR